MTRHVKAMTSYRVTLRNKFASVVRNALGVLRGIGMLGRTVQCPCCGWHQRAFRPWDPSDESDPNTVCARCGSQSRHRMLHLFLREYLREHDIHSIAHFAPESYLSRLINSPESSWVCHFDLTRCDVDVRADIARLPVKGATFDLIICNHVLEHIFDDVAALRELMRVLREDGCAIVTVPVNESLQETYEDPDAVTPEQRLRLFGQVDHVRVYGGDVLTRLQQSGAGIECLEYGKVLGEDMCRRHGLVPDEPLYLCMKSQSRRRDP